MQAQASGLHRRSVALAEDAGQSQAPSKPRARRYCDRLCCGVASVVLLTSASVLLEIVQEIGQLAVHRLTADPRHADLLPGPQGSFLLQMQQPPPERGAHLQHYSSQKCGNSWKTGVSAYVAPRDLSRPSWTWQHHAPNMWHPPVIDGAGNIYLAMYAIDLVSLTADGRLRWRAQVGISKDPSRGHVSAPLLLGGFVYATDGEAFLVKLSLETGAEQWRVRYTWDFESMGNNALSGNGGTVLLTGSCSQWLRPYCKTTLLALDADDGHVLWKQVAGPFGPEVHANKNPAVTEDSVVVMDNHGATICYDLANGTIRWWGIAAPSMDALPGVRVTGGAAVGPNGVVYADAAHWTGGRELGYVAAFDHGSGSRLWLRTLELPAKNVPSVYAAGGRPLVVVGLGSRLVSAVSPSFPPEAPERGMVVALDGGTGDTVWSFEPPPSACRQCNPERWSSAAVGADGVVYIGHCDGVVYALNGTNGALLSSHATGSAISANPAIAPGMLVVASCTQTTAFRSGPGPAGR